MAANPFFPDNPKRERRVQELTSDIVTFASNLTQDATDIQTLLQQLDATVIKMYADIHVNIPATDTKTLDFNGWTINVFQGFQTMFTIPNVANALKTAGASHQLSNGQAGGAALANQIGLPSWLKLGPGTAPAIAVIGVDLGLGIVSGAVKRDKLRNAIHSCIKPRINLKEATIITGMLYQKLLVFKDSFYMMTQLGYTKDQLDKIQANNSSAFEAEVTKVTDNTAIQQLASLDKGRGSWTNEDH